MERIWQWAWDRFGAKYSWLLCVSGCLFAIPNYLVVILAIVAVERSGHYIEATLVTVVSVAVLAVAIGLSARRLIRPAEQFAAGHKVDRVVALQSTYTYARRMSYRVFWTNSIMLGVLAFGVGVITGAPASRLVQYAIIGATYAAAAHLVGFHTASESGWRPARIDIAGDTGIGDSLPRRRPTFAARSNVAMLGVAFAFALLSALLATAVGKAAAVQVFSVDYGTTAPGTR